MADKLDKQLALKKITLHDPHYRNTKYIPSAKMDMVSRFSVYKKPDSLAERIKTTKKL